jgi:O-antigen/teichoic acid export membrane protein
MSNKIFENKFYKSVIILLTGTLIAQAIPLAISPVLTRLFTAENFGLFALYFSISQIMSVFITGRYEYAIILPEKDEDAINIVALCLSITLLISVLSAFIILPFRYFIADLLNKHEIGAYLFLIPVTICAIGIYTTFNLWFNRKGYFRNVSFGKIFRSSFSSFFSIGFGLTILKSAGLIIADTIGQMAAAFYLSFRFLKSEREKIKSVSKVGMKEQARRYIQFPKYNILSGLLEKGSGQLPVILLTAFFGSSVTGLFSLSQRVIAAPEGLISVSIGDVFRQKASIEFQQNGNCRKTFLDLFKLLFSISIIPFILLTIFAPSLFAFVFGEEWRIAGNYAQIMTMMFFLSFIVSPLSNMFIIAQKQKIDLIIQIVLFAFICVSFIAGFNIFRNPGKAILLYTIIYSIKYCIEFYLSFKFSKGKVQPPIN